jgi:type II secretory pathway pseudopilin PulG
MQHKTTTFQQRLANQIAKHRNSQEGITLLESLVSIIVLTIAITAVTPPIFLAVATRMQNRRAEQAMHLAQKYVDRVQGLVRQGNYDPEITPTGRNDRGLPEIPAQNNNSADPSQIGPPNSNNNNGGLFGNVLDSPNPNCNNFTNFNPNNMPPWDEALRVDVDGDCQPDFFVQIFRSSLQQVNNGQVVAFPMGVRVYAWAAQNNGTVNSNLGVQEASLGPTEGLGEQTTQPLAVSYSCVVYSENINSLQWYRNNLQALPPNSC